MNNERIFACIRMRQSLISHFRDQREQEISKSPLMVIFKCFFRIVIKNLSYFKNSPKIQKLMTNYKRVLLLYLRESLWASLLSIDLLQYSLSIKK